MELSPRTILDRLRQLADCRQHGARFVHRSGDASFHSYAELLERATTAAAALQARGVAPGDRVALVLPTSIEFIESFLGVQLAGAIPAALYPPLRLGRLEEYFVRTRGMLEKIGARYLVTDRRVRQILGPAVDGVRDLEAVLEAGRLGPPGRLSRIDPDPDQPAFLQFSSGTTHDPKAVVVTHANLLANLDMIDGYFQSLTPAEIERGGVCWLPLYHDMGLVGHMYVGLYHPGTVTYIGPERFIAKPAIWLQTLSRYQGVVSGAPDFAYGLCVSKVKDDDLAGVDLSGWKIAFNGAEPISADAMSAFSARFARWGFRPEAMTPVYGLAEAGLAVSFSDPGRAPVIAEFDRRRILERAEAIPGRGRRLVSVGRPMAGLEIAIRSDGGGALEHGQIGRIAVKGPSISPGYFGAPELTDRAFSAGWLDTGDLGFFAADQLYITGRVKDLIIIRGRNYAPQEIEELLAGLHGMRAGCCVALGLPGDEGERLLVLAERDVTRPRADAELEAEIHERVLNGVGLQPGQIELLPPGTLPRTSSGKLRRAEALRLHLSGRLEEPNKMGALRLARELARSRLAWLRFWLRRTLGARPLPERLP